MTCQDNCLYYPLCRDSGFLMYSVRTAKTLTLTENVEKECPFKKFKNKTDFVEVETIKDWLYEVAIDNVGCVYEGDFSNACEEIISRIDGLRNFARERRDT